jgi:mannose-6-phosphate isomerase-like protein (cupin superfamily)
MEDKVVKQLLDKYIQRSELGIKKYGTTLEQNNNDNFLKHLQEELMDASLYIQKLIGKNEFREWGQFEVLLDSGTCKVKRITVNPGQRISYQYHHKRSEVWVIVQGKAELTINDTVIEVGKGFHVHIPKLSKHRIKNIGDTELVFIETQTGDYFGEDDIVRLSDDYGRQ